MVAFLLFSLKKKKLHGILFSLNFLPNFVRKILKGHEMLTSPCTGSFIPFLIKFLHFNLQFFYYVVDIVHSTHVLYSCKFSFD